MRASLFITIVLFLTFSSQSTMTIQANLNIPQDDVFVISGVEQFKKIYEPLEEKIIIPTQPKSYETGKENGMWLWPVHEQFLVICSYLGYELHHAIDIYGDTGTNVLASRDGVVENMNAGCPDVSKNALECGGGYGNYVTLKHESDLFSRYAHLENVKVKSGQSVKRGDVLGQIGTSGRVGAPHLHFEIRNDTQRMKKGGFNPLDETLVYYDFMGDNKKNDSSFLNFLENGAYIEKEELVSGLPNLLQSMFMSYPTALNEKLENLIASRVTNKWLYNEGNYAYVNTNGEKVKGWLSYHEQNYFFDDSGTLVRDEMMDGFIMSSSGIAYKDGELNAEYIVIHVIERLSKLGYTYTPNLETPTHILNGTPGYEEALTEAVVVEIIKSEGTNFNIYVKGNQAFINVLK